jgi:hypothetical protein
MGLASFGSYDPVSRDLSGQFIVSIVDQPAALWEGSPSNERGMKLDSKAAGISHVKLSPRP